MQRWALLLTSLMHTPEQEVAKSSWGEVLCMGTLCSGQTQTLQSWCGGEGGCPEFDHNPGAASAQGRASILLLEGWRKQTVSLS